MASAYNIFPVINASLNGASAVLIITGHSFIKKNNMRLHRACMITAVVTSTLFLASYVFYHLHVRSVHFPGTGLVRTLYLTILFSHTVLAAMGPFLVGFSLSYALQEKFDRHRKISRWT